MDKYLLEQIGLSRGEIEVYSILLKIGEASASEIARHTKIARPNVYDYLNKLKEKGLLSFVNKSNKINYFPASPQKILDCLEEKESLIKQELPNLLKIYNQEKKKNVVELWEGVEGYRNLMNDIIKTAKDFVGWGASDKVKESVPDYIIERYLKERESKKIRARLLFAEPESVLKTPMSEFKAISKEFVSPTTTIVYGDRVAVMIYTPVPLIIIIKSPSLAKSYKNYFELLWKMAKKK